MILIIPYIVQNLYLHLSMSFILGLYPPYHTSPIYPADVPHESCSTDKTYDKTIQIAKYLSALVKTDVTSLYNDRDKCTLSSLLGYSPEECLGQRPKHLVGLLRHLLRLRHLCGYSEAMNSEESKKVAKCMKLIYGCHNSKIVLPISFQEIAFVFNLQE